MANGFPDLRSSSRLSMPSLNSLTICLTVSRSPYLCGSQVESCLSIEVTWSQNGIHSHNTSQVCSLQEPPKRKQVLESRNSDNTVMLFDRLCRLSLIFPYHCFMGEAQNPSVTPCKSYAWLDVMICHFHLMCQVCPFTPC